MRRRIRSAAFPVHRHSVPQLVVDGVLVALAYYLAFRLRFTDGLSGTNDKYGDLLAATIYWVVPASLVTLALFGQYQRLWTFVGQRDYEAVAKAMLGLSFDTPIGKLTFDAKTHETGMGEFWGQMVKDDRYPFAIMKDPKYLSQGPYTQ